MSISRARLHRLGRDGDGRVPALQRVRANLDDAILTCLVGTNLSNVLASAVTTALLTALLGPRGEWLAVVVASLVLVVLAEILPKILYREFPERLTLASLPLLRTFHALIVPVRWPLSGYARLLQRLQGASAAAGYGLDRASLASLLSSAAPDQGDRRFHHTMTRFLELSSRCVADLMRPLASVITVPADVTLEQALSVAAESGFSRLPVRGTEGDLDGYLLVRDMLLAEAAPAALVRPLLLVDSGLSPYELFEELHARGAQFAAVVDRDGRPLGIVTLEDLIEKVTGAIADEFDQPEESA